MRDAVDSRHACPCCSNDIRGRTVRRVLRHVNTPDRVYTRRKGVAARIKMQPYGIRRHAALTRLPRCAQRPPGQVCA
jgi:hypothetical protein